MSSQNIYILGIESSCDDTAASIIHNGRILSNVVATQKIHEEYGGVVPELASRAHQQNIVPVVHQAIKKHTQIVQVDDYFKMSVIGETIDDAVGEAFDKSGKILGLGYPAGPEIDKRAALGNPKAFKFTKPKVDGLNFSFSGFKTAVLYFIQREVKANPNFIAEHLNDICASIQYTIIGILMDKLKLATKQTGINHIAIGGGVSANSGIRQALKDGEQKFGWSTYIPKFEFTTDNAAMIAIVGYLKFLEGDFAQQDVVASARLKI